MTALSQKLYQKPAQVALLSLSQALVMGLWFAASAVAPQLNAELGLSDSAQSWMTIILQIGFVVGALTSALLNLADRIPGQIVVAVSALIAAALNALIPFMGQSVTMILVLRGLIGVCMAGVYPPGMKLAASWSKSDRGLVIGILIGALSFGSALPHLINALPFFENITGPGMPPWRETLYVGSALALIGGALVALLVRPGPQLAQAAPFNWRVAPRVFTHRPTRLANFGYLGHMWELYAMWTWAPLLLLHSFSLSHWSAQGARIAGFATVAIGAVGCVLAGKLADSLGRERVTIWSMLISGACCVAAGFLISTPALLVTLCLIWGFAVVADSAQFSAAVSELFDQRYIGTALTLQTSLGFLLTTLTIRLIPIAVEYLGWEYAFVILTPGPIFGILSMAQLRRLRGL